jgi:hypothetical protein
LYDATYKDDWRKLVPSVFLYRVENAMRIARALHGLYTDEDERKDDVARLNREIIIKQHFPTYFPEDDDV